MADPLGVTASIIAVLQLSSTVLGYLVDVKDASANRKSLIREISFTRGILSTLNETVDDARVSDETWSATIRSLEDPDGPLRLLTTTLQQLATTLEDSASATGIKKSANLLRWPFKQSEVEKILRVIERQKSTLSLALENDHIALSREIRNNTKAIQDDITGLSREFAAARLDAKTDAENTILNQLPYADGAPFNAFRRDYECDCLPDTRVELLNEITTWGDTSDGPCVFWLNGMAGTGKSTISRTVAHHFADQRRLGASFFFSRGQGDLGHAEKFFTTIASQMAHALPTLKRHICEAIAEDHRIGTQGLSEQWKKLIFRPLSKLENTLSQGLPIILVIDALDECEREDRKDDTQVILRLLAEAKDLSTIQLRIFLTSRPEVSIYHSFSAMSRLTHQDCILHHISRDVIDHDILIFIQYEFERIRNKRGLLLNWPRMEDVNFLARAADSLFIYAATICRFIDRRHPEKQLSIILQCMGSSPPTLRASPTQSLDEMYSQVLKSSIYMNYDEEDREEVLDLFKQTVGSLVILLDILSTAALTRLLDLLIRDVDEILKQLQAVLDVPDTLDLPVRLLHPSFRDFLLDKNRCNDLQFWVDERQAHRTLTNDCIRLMSKFLKQDICDVGRPGALVADVESSQMEQCLPSEVQYACLYWIQHLQKSGAQLSENDQVHQFLQVHILHWLEALSWMGRLSEGIHAITSLESIAFNSHCSRLYAFVHDLKRFALYNCSGIEQTPLQIYCGALVFAPESSIIKINFRSRVPGCVRRLPKVPNDWNALMQVLEGHSGAVRTVAFSPEFKQLASASEDNTIRLWDAASGMALQTLEGHSSCAYAVAYSPDGKLLASASDDMTVRLWDAATGAGLQTLNAHSSGVAAIAFSPDGKMLATASSDKTVRLWDVVTGFALQQFSDYLGWTNKIAFSPDGKLLVSTFSVDAVIVWHPITGAVPQKINNYESWDNAVVFSPDGKRLAISSDNGIVRVWDLTTEAVLHLLDGLNEVVIMAFSADNKLLAAASLQGIQLCNVTRGTVLQIVGGYSYQVYGMAFSPDCKQLATASNDGRVRLWDLASMGSPQTFNGHPREVSKLCFSPDGKLLASMSPSYHGIVLLWDVITGVVLQTLDGHSSRVIDIAFSPNGKLLVSTSNDWMVKLWDPATGLLLQTFGGHSKGVNAVAFSLDGKQLATASYDSTVRLWDITTRPILQMLQFNSRFATAVAFSPDGSHLACALNKHLIQLLNTGSRAMVQTLECYSGSIMAVTFSPNSKQLASASTDKTVRLWDIDSGTTIQIFNLEVYIDSLSFSDDGTVLQTNRGPLSTTFASHGAAFSRPNRSCDIFVKEQWISQGNENILWLPPEYRPSCTAVREGVVALGHASGRVSILEVTF